jgi:hypothetical protein
VARAKVDALQEGVEVLRRKFFLTGAF